LQQSQSSIVDSFSQLRANKRPRSLEEFDNNKFKKLLLNFIISNNLSFRSVTTESFKKLVYFLNK
jgi:inorganic pyrophosphatase/exopolyphosphatase